MSSHDSSHSSLAKNSNKATVKKPAAPDAAKKNLLSMLELAIQMEASFNDARGTGITSVMRDSAANAEVLLYHMVAAREEFEAAVPNSKAAPESLQHVLNRSELVELHLRAGIVRIRMEADDLDRAQGGPLSQLPQGELQTTPEGIRRQARENAPPGLCDDELLQGSAACPLDHKLRDTNRELVRDQLASIASNWHQAVGLVNTDTRFKALVQHGGAASVRDLLLNLALGWVGGTLVGLAMKKVTSAVGPYTMKAALKETAFSLEELTTAFTAVGKKGGEKVAGAMKQSAAPDNVGAIMGGFAQLATDWEQASKQSVRYLPDAALTALGSGLKTCPFTVQYFQNKLNQVMERYGELDKGMGKRGFAAAQTTTLWVVHPNGGGRMALVTQEEKETKSGHNTRSSDVVATTTGRYIFVKWVDRSLESVALDLGRQRQLVTTVALTTTDSKWANPDASGLSDWHANPASRDDVAMFGGK